MEVLCVCVHQVFRIFCVFYRTAQCDQLFVFQVLNGCLWMLAVVLGSVTLEVPVPYDSVCNNLPCTRWGPAALLKLINSENST